MFLKTGFSIGKLNIAIFPCVDIFLHPLMFFSKYWHRVAIILALHMAELDNINKKLIGVIVHVAKTQ